MVSKLQMVPPTLIERPAAPERAIDPESAPANYFSLHAMDPDFWSRVAPGEGVDACWLWTGTRDSKYGSISIDGRNYKAHRIAFGLAGGELSEEQVCRHRCDTPLCVRPDHLEAGSHSDNVADRVKRGRSARGSRNGRSKLTEVQVRVIKLRLAAGARPAHLARAFKVRSSAIDKIRSGENWRHVA